LDDMRIPITGGELNKAELIADQRKALRGVSSFVTLSFFHFVAHKRPSCLIFGGGDIISLL